MEKLLEYCRELKKRLLWLQVRMIGEGSWLVLTDKRSDHVTSQLFPAYGLSSNIAYMLKMWQQPKEQVKSIKNFKRLFIAEVERMMRAWVREDRVRAVLTKIRKPLAASMKTAAANLVSSIQRMLSHTLKATRELDREWEDR